MRGRLPTETEWEYAARHPHIGWVETPKLYPWGDEAPSNETEWRLNLWQGDFPRTDAALDGHAGLAPADRLRAHPNPNPSPNPKPSPNPNPNTNPDR